MQHAPVADPHLAVVRADAADRARRAERFRQREEASAASHLDRRRALVTLVATVAVSFGIVAMAPSRVADETTLVPSKPSVVVEDLPVEDEPVRQGTTPGRPDGWYEPPAAVRRPPGSYR